MEAESTLVSPFASALLDRDLAGWRPLLRRFAAGLALSSVYGLVLGARFGPLAMAVHAVGVPLALVAVALLGAPAFYIGLSHAGLAVEVPALAGAVARAVALTGLVLAGLAPALLLVALSAETAAGAVVHGGLGLAVAGWIGLRALGRDLAAAVPEADGMGARLVRLGFTMFAALLAGRVWWLTLPLFARALEEVSR